jgi:hypothetical protein
MSKNEFFVTSVKEECAYFDVTCKEPVSINPDDVICDCHDVRPYIMPQSQAAGFVEKMPGRKSVKIKLESAGDYDIKILNAAMAIGKKVKIEIVND